MEPGDIENFKKEILKEGTGDTPKKGDKLGMHYTGTLTNGRKFDSSRDRSKLFEFKIGVGEVIKGWDEGVIQMRLGEISKLYIPSSMGYGKEGVGNGLIPGGAGLIFEVELVSINGKKASE